MYEQNFLSANESESLIINLGVTRDDLNRPVLCYSVLAKALPEYIDIHSEGLQVRKFTMNERLIENGSIIDIAGEGKEGISLEGYTACWAPKYDCVLDNLLKCCYEMKTKDKVVNKAKEEMGLIHSYNMTGVEELSKMMKDKKVVIFTGAGISVNAGVVNLEELMDLYQKMFLPIEQYYGDVVKGNTAARLAIWEQLNSMFLESKPTQSHWIIKELCNSYGFTLATGNVDGLHEKTGITPIFQNSDKAVIPELNSYDMLVTIGLSDEGIGEVAKEYHSGNPKGIIVAINKAAPGYLGSKDYFLEGESDTVLAELKEILVGGK